MRMQNDDFVLNSHSAASAVDKCEKKFKKRLIYSVRICKVV